jgi:predicted Zn-dependent peptidase
LNYQFHTLKNGIRIVHQEVKSNVSHCGLMVNTGSRDEHPDESGMAHFIEHMIFKGTKKRKAYHVLSRIENIGGDLNAFTTKEETCIYASFLSPYYRQSLELFADVAFNSTFPQKEMAKEKDVIIDEINSYNDSPAELIFDDFEEMVFTGHPIGSNILGNIKSVEAFKRNEVFRFIKRNYSTNQMVISSVGNIKFERLVGLIEKYFGSIRTSLNGVHRKPYTDYHQRQSTLNKDSYLTHAVIGNIAYSRNDDKNYALALLTNLLGGPALNTRLNLSIREKYGYAYNIEAAYQPYSDTGVFAIYIGSDRNHINKSLNLVQKELRILREKSLGTIQLQRAKKQITGQLAISFESRLNEMLGIAKSHLHDNEVKTFDEIVNEIEAISTAEILEVANEIFNPDKLSTLIYKAKEE